MPPKKNSKPSKAISIQQPYAESILRGIKDAEYRTRVTHKRERVYIYATLKPGDAEDFKRIGVEPGSLPTGVIVGTVEIVDCKYREHKSNYKYAWKLANPKRLRKVLKPDRHPQPEFFKPFNS